MARNRSVVAFRLRLEHAIPGIVTAIGAATEQGAQEIADAMRAAVPKKTGTLAASIRVEAGRRRGRWLVKAGGAATTKPIRNSEKGNAPYYDYAMAVEFGTKPHYPGGRYSGLHPGARPRPFFWPSYRARKRGVSSRVLRGAKTAILQLIGAPNA